jgi:tetratricopeptide (TPR) repeat protein
VAPERTGQEEHRDAAALLKAYRQAVDRMASSNPIGSLAVLDALLARDRVAEEAGRLEPVQVLELAACDRTLRHRAREITGQIGRQALAAWQNSADPGLERWWWSLHRLPEATTKLEWGLGRSSVVLLGLSFIVMADLAARLLKVTAVSEGLAALAVQALLLYLTSRGLTDAGLAALQGALARVRFPSGRNAASVFMAILSAFLLAFAVLAWWATPRLVAAHYARRGDVARGERAWYRAIEDYDRAAVLDPDDAGIHYGLAVACEESRQLERAVEEYTAASRLDGVSVGPDNIARFESTINGLAQLFIAYRKDPSAARAVLDRLEQPLKRGLLSDAAKYFLFRNRGWAKLVLGSNGEAEDYLRTALRVRNGASARFLLGKALVASGQEQAARAEFNETMRIIQTQPRAERELDPTWITEAQQELQKTGGK